MQRQKRSITIQEIEMCRPAFLIGRPTGCTAARSRLYGTYAIGKDRTQSEGRWLIREFVPEPVTATRITELRRYYAGKRRPEHTAGQRPFRYAA